jgi:DNA-binding NtrC family response regulator
LLAEHFLRHFSKQAGRRTPKLSSSARKRLISHTWPGNVRELRNLAERLAYLSAGEKIEAEDLAFILSPTNAGAAAIGEGLTLNDATDQFQTEYIKQSIARARGNVSLAAKNLGVHRSNLYRKMRQLGMATDDGESDA